MRFFLVPVIVMLLFNALVDYCIYRTLRRCFTSRWPARVQAVTAVLFDVLLLLVICLPKRNGADPMLLSVMWGLYAYLTIYIPKYIFLVFDLLSKLPRLWRSRQSKDGSLPACASQRDRVSKAVLVTGAVLGVIVFAMMWWGALINRLRIQVREVQVAVQGLPSAFDGFTIAQISDLHVGTFGEDTAFVSKLVDRINALHPDVIVFTGDIVNRRSEEFEPFIKPMSRLSAPYGVYSIMGNHDYGDYSDWPSDGAHQQDIRHIKDMEAQAGMHMLNNSHCWLRHDGDSIALIGVENIGDPPFKRYGDLDAAYDNLADSNVKVLLTHNPAHWEDVIADHPVNVALTLSGHTHAMQCELFGWSPAVWRYDKWGGAYTDTRGQMLYVNIGAGTVGMPYRIGATPEITLLRLVPAQPR